MTSPLRIGEAAALLGVSRETLRHYEKRGLIRPSRAENGYQRREKSSIPTDAGHNDTAQGFAPRDIHDGESNDVGEQRKCEPLENGDVPLVFKPNLRCHGDKAEGD